MLLDFGQHLAQFGQEKVSTTEKHLALIGPLRMVHMVHVTLLKVK